MVQFPMSLRFSSGYAACLRAFPSGPIGPRVLHLYMGADIFAASTFFHPRPGLNGKSALCVIDSAMLFTG
ncbi:hypothetical protein FKM82_015450 [Ascaphus truei]